MKPSINRSCARLLVLTSYKHLKNFEILCSFRNVSVQQHGAVISRIISSCKDSVVSYWMKAMTQTLSVATYLHRIKQMKHSPCCTHCSQDGSQKESVLHFFN